MKAFLGITSCKRFDERRQACRETWLRDARRHSIEYRFVTGEQVNDGHDVLVAGCEDDYSNVWKKTLVLLKYALSVPDWTHFIKADDDSYMVLERVLPSLCADYGGALNNHEDVPYGSGAASYLSRKAVEIVVQEMKGGGFDDLEIGRILHRKGIAFVPDERWSSSMRNETPPLPKPDNDSITTHYLTPETMRALHEDMHPLIATVRKLAGPQRADTFAAAATFIMSLDKPVLVETGCYRGCDADGCSTLILAMLAEATDGTLHTFEISEEHIGSMVTMLGERATSSANQRVCVHQGDSVEKLGNFQGRIDFAYLDSFDHDPTNPGPCQRHELAEIGAIYAKMNPCSAILLDDNVPETGGKPLLGAAFLRDRGWTQEHDGYQLFFTRCA